MPTVTQGNTGTYQFNVGEQATISPAPGSRASVLVTSAAGATRFSNNLASAATIGPYSVGDVLSVTATNGSVDYSTSSTLTVAASTRALPRICFFTDSLGQYNVNRLGQNVSGTTGSVGTAVNILWTETETPAGSGSLTYDAGSRTLSWAAPGEAVGVLVDASKSGMLYVPSSVAGHGIYLVWLPTRGYVSGTLSVTVSGDGFQQWAYASKGFGLAALAACGWRYQLAKLPAGCPVGMDGFYGLGGATSAELLAAMPQWSQIEGEVAVVQIGTNSMNGGASSASVASDTQLICEGLLNKFQLVIYTDIVPRTGESATSKQRKAAVLKAMQAYALTKSGRVQIWSAAAQLVDPATGDYASGMSPDNIHTAAKGGTSWGFPFGAYLATLCANAPTTPSDYRDAYNATENPFGNLLGPTMSNMVGSAGTAGTGASGSVATGWTAARQTGAAMTLTCSKVARTDGVPGEWQQITLASAAANEVARLLPSVALTTGIVVGQEYMMEVEIRIVSCTSLNILGPVTPMTGVAARAADGWQGQGTDAIADLAPDTSRAPIWLRIPPNWKVPVGATSVFTNIQFGTASGGAAVLQIGRVRFNRTA